MISVQNGNQIVTRPPNHDILKYRRNRVTSIHAYYDGQSYVTQGSVVVKPNQKVIITLLDDFVPIRRKRSLSEIKRYMDSSSKSVPDGVSTADYVRQLREE